MFFVAVSVELSWWRISFRTANAQVSAGEGVSGKLYYLALV